MPNTNPEVMEKLIKLRNEHMYNTKNVNKGGEILSVFNHIFARANFLLHGGDVDEITNNWYNEASPTDSLLVYRITADEDERTCPLCAAANGLVLVSELRAPGYTAPPFHPNCRCKIDEWYQSGAIDTLPGWQIVNAKLSPPFTPSDEILAFIMSYEGFRASPYYASAAEKAEGTRTIGFGHVILPEEEALYPAGYEMSRDEALELFLRDIASYAGEMNEVFADPENNITLTQNQFDASLSFYYNTRRLMRTDWWGAFQNGGSNEDILAGFLQYTRACSDHLAGLYRRRVDEWEIFMGMGYERDYDRKAPEGYI